MKTYPQKIMINMPGNKPQAAKKLAGFTMIEMMISITIGLVIIAALVGVLSSNAGQTRTNERTSEMQTSGRFALDTIKRELRHAGYRGFTFVYAPLTSPVLTPITGECLQAAAAAGTFVANISQGVWGANDTNPFAANCIPVANSAGGDVLVVRHLTTMPPASTASVIRFRSAYSGGEIFRTGAAPACVGAMSGASAPFNTEPCINGVPLVDLIDFAVQVYVYYISPYTSSPTENPLVPALYRVALRPDGSMSPELVASGVEHFQVQFGRLTTDGNTRYYNADQITGTSTTFQTSIQPWNDVNSVKIWLLTRNSTAEPGYSNTNTYTMGDKNYPKSDGFRRQLFTSLVQLRN
jgi:type IV pilus assembly protein PilW